jgi:DNA-binding response OmpR family regulator
MATGQMEAKLDLSKTVVMLLQNNTTEVDILGQVFQGFGVKATRKCTTAEQAEEMVRATEFDLLVIDAEMPGGKGFNFVQKLRRMQDCPNRLAPVILVSGHTPHKSVLRARDCGANIVVTKPITPKVLFDRIVWLVKDVRQFVESDGYVGPDRRHKAYGPPPGTKGRRKDDLNPTVLGAPAGPDLMQDEIDALLKPRRAVT